MYQLHKTCMFLAISYTLISHFCNLSLIAEQSNKLRSIQVYHKFDQIKNIEPPQKDNTSNKRIKK